MATIYKKTDRKPVPNQAEVVTRSGRRFVRLADSKGRTRSYPLAADGTHNLVERPSYYIDYDGPDGKRITVKGYPDREATEAMARNLERDSARVREGLIVADRHKARVPISEVLESYAEDLRRQDRDHIYITRQLSQRSWPGNAAGPR